MENKEFTKKIKLLFSSLFGRAMNCAIIGCPDYADNVWLFTNIPVEEMEIYSPSSEYYMHKVEITDSDLYAEIITRFPILSSAIVFLDLNKFMSCYNKSEKTPEAMKLSIVEENIVFTCNELSVVCGSLLPEFTATLYSSLFERSVIKTENPYIQKLSKKDLNIDTATFIPIYTKDLVISTSKKTMAVLLPKKNIICLKEFFSKAELGEEWFITLKSGSDDNSVRFQTQYICPFYRVDSVQPAIQFFVTN